MERAVSELVSRMKKDKDILAVSVFGSYARGEHYRDIDICIFLKGGELGRLGMAKKRLKYLSEASGNFDIQVFQQLPLYIKHRVLKEGKILFCRDQNKLYDIAHAFIREWEDFKPIYEKYLEGVANG